MVLGGERGGGDTRRLIAGPRSGAVCSAYVAYAAYAAEPGSFNWHQPSIFTNRLGAFVRQIGETRADLTSPKFFNIGKMSFFAWRGPTAPMSNVGLHVNCSNSTPSSSHDLIRMRVTDLPPSTCQVVCEAVRHANGGGRAGGHSRHQPDRRARKGASRNALE